MFVGAWEVHGGSVRGGGGGGAAAAAVRNEFRGFFDSSWKGKDRIHSVRERMVELEKDNSTRIVLAASCNAFFGSCALGSHTLPNSLAFSFSPNRNSNC